MFTGIIQELGTVKAITPLGDSARIRVTGPASVVGIKHGDSISVNGVCLTAVDFDESGFSADVMKETLRMSVLGELAPGSQVNLEPAARFGDSIGGHIVQGHVDGTARVLEVEDAPNWRRVRVSLPADLAPLVTLKGSVTVSGVSLTVSGIGNNEGGDWFEVSLIPATCEKTTLGSLRAGDHVNLETDVLARQVLRILEATGALSGHRYKQHAADTAESFGDKK